MIFAPPHYLSRVKGYSQLLLCEARKPVTDSVSHTMVEGEASLNIWSSVTGYILLLLDVSNEWVRVLISLEKAPICLAVLSLSTSAPVCDPFAGIVKAPLDTLPFGLSPRPPPCSAPSSMGQTKSSRSN